MWAGLWMPHFFFYPEEEEEEAGVGPQQMVPSEVFTQSSNFNAHMIIYMFQYYPLKSSHPRLLPQGPKDCSVRLCLYCGLLYRAVVTVFLNSIHMP